jgi:chromosome segregation ATPase
MELSARLTSLREYQHQTSADLERLEREAAQAKQLYTEYLNRFKAMTIEYKRLDPEEQWQAELEAEVPDAPDSIELLEDSVQQFETMIDGMHVNPQEIRNYRERQVQIEKLERDAESTSADQTAALNELLKLAAEWKTEAEQQIGVASAAFAKFFADIGCKGELKLSLEPGAEPDDYSKYGVAIWVSFRASAPMQQLTDKLQSGGERSVSTMLFLLALQEITECPFRVVDEINQGMDPRNERMIFETIARCGYAENTPQYFMVTPKLLPNLPITAETTVFCVFNGLYVVPQKGIV